MRKRLNEELGRKSVGEYRSSEKSPVVIVLDNVRSHNNIGSVFRTADAFLCEKIFLCGITATPPHRDIHKTALGATDSVAWEYSGSSFNVRKEEKYALVFGHEINGVSQEVVNISDACVEIPQFGTKHSFNIAVSAGIVLWELNRKMSLL